MAGLWPAVSLAGLPLVVCCGWGKALILFALWVNMLIVGLLEAIAGGFGGWGLCWVGLWGKGAVLGFIGVGGMSRNTLF